MTFKKFKRPSERSNKFEHAKIIAIVDHGEVIGYDWTLTQNADDFFATRQDRQKYKAITLKPIACESMSELREKFRVALTYLQVGAALTTPRAKDVMKSLKEYNGSAEWHNAVNDCGVLISLGIYEDKIVDPIPHVSPLARGKFVDFAYKRDEISPSLRVVSMLNEADYKLGDRIQLCIDPPLEVNDKPKEVWVMVVACHQEMWTNDDHDDDDDDFWQDVFIGRKDGSNKLIRFTPNHVIQHKDHTTQAAEFAKWLIMKGGPTNDSDSDDCKAFPDWLFPKVKISEQQSDAAPPVTAPTPEPSASVQPVPAVAAPEQSALLPAPTLQRQRRHRQAV